MYLDPTACECRACDTLAVPCVMVATPRSHHRPVAPRANRLLYERPVASDLPPLSTSGRRGVASGREVASSPGAARPAPSPETRRRMPSSTSQHAGACVGVTHVLPTPRDRGHRSFAAGRRRAPPPMHETGERRPATCRGVSPGARCWTHSSAPFASVAPFRIGY